MFLEWFGAVADAVAGIGVAGAVAYIACLQFRLDKRTTARQLKNEEIRLRWDLFDRRYRFFEAVRSLLGQAGAHSPGITNEDLAVYEGATRGASFIFGNDVANYIEKLRTNAQRLMLLGIQLKDRPIKENERQQCVKEQSDLTQWFSDQYAVLEPKFGRDLRLEI